MQNYTLTHVSDAVLLRDLARLVARDRATTATLLAHIAEVDERKLYRPAGYSSMYAYCVEKLRLSEDAAYKRIQAARVARRFPALFAALAGGSLHLAAICLLAPHLTPESAWELIEMATHKGKSEIEDLLARRFPASPDATVRGLFAMAQHAPGHVRGLDAGAGPEAQLAPGQVESTQVQSLPQNRVRFMVQFAVTQSTRDKLRHARDLLSHAVPDGDMAEVLDRALDVLILKLERRKTGRARRPRAVERVAADVRHVPAHVRRVVWERDEGRCSFVGADGHRCAARRFLEFDHIDPLARGGKTMADNMRLRCRAHNQYEAERAFGAGHMKQKRQIQDVMTGLRGLGCRAGDARRAAEFTGTLHCATLEDRMLAALRFLPQRR